VAHGPYFHCDEYKRSSGQMSEIPRLVSVPPLISVLFRSELHAGQLVDWGRKLSVAVAARPSVSCPSRLSLPLPAVDTAEILNGSSDVAAMMMYGKSAATAAKISLRLIKVLKTRRGGADQQWRWSARKKYFCKFRLIHSFIPAVCRVGLLLLCAADAG
jgi:hypothetical protein